MLYGESSDQETIRHIQEETAISEWLSTLEPDVVQAQGTALRGLVRARIRSHHDGSTAMGQVMLLQMQARLGHDLTESDRDHYRRALRAWSIASSQERPLPEEAPTGYAGVDEYVQQERDFLGCQSPEAVLTAFDLLDGVTQVAQSVYADTTPGSLAA